MLIRTLLGRTPLARTLLGRTLLIRALLAFVVVGAVLALDSPGVGACSCAAKPADDLLGTHEDAFIGSLVAKPAPRGEGNGVFSSGQEAATPPPAVPAASPDAADERTWLGWLSGFVAVGVVLGLVAVTAALMRRLRVRR